MQKNEASLISRAKLTEGELKALRDSQGTISVVVGQPERRSPSLRTVADAATAKALRAVTEWLRDEDVSEMMGYPEVIDVRALLVEELEQASIPYPVEGES